MGLRPKRSRRPRATPIAALLSLALAFAATDTGCTKKSGSVSQVTAMEAMGQLRNDFAVLIDVREPEETRAGGMAAQARSMPMSKIEANDPAWQELVKGLPKDKQVIFYCQGGGRAAKAAEALAAQGYRTASMGGFDDWVKAGLPTKAAE